MSVPICAIASSPRASRFSRWTICSQGWSAIHHLRGHPQFEFRRQDVTVPFEIESGVDFVLHMASPASPRDYMMFPIETLDVGSLGTRQMLELAQRKNA